jgi:hypothetical protein
MLRLYNSFALKGIFGPVGKVTANCFFESFISGQRQS